MEGLQLIDKICQSTDLPEELLNRELLSLLTANNINSEELTLDQLRDLLSEYLQDTLIKLKEEMAG